MTVLSSLSVTVIGFWVDFRAHNFFKNASINVTGPVKPGA